MAKAEYRSAQRSRRMINEALGALMQEKPLDKITVTDVVKRADLNRGTFYAHYTDIQDVVNRQVEEACLTLRQALRGNQPGSDPSPDSATVLRQIQAFLESDLPFFTSLFNSSIAGPSMEKIRQVFIDYMLEHEREFKVQDHEAYLFKALYVSGGLIVMYQDWAAGRLPLTLTQLTEKAIDAVHCMTGTAAG